MLLIPSGSTVLILALAGLFSVRAAFWAALTIHFSCWLFSRFAHFFPVQETLLTGGLFKKAT
jgi:hypothetical protein